jgi:hypothetical protein
MSWRWRIPGPVGLVKMAQQGNDARSAGSALSAGCADEQSLVNQVNKTGRPAGRPVNTVPGISPRQRWLFLLPWTSRTSGEPAPGHPPCRMP